MANVSLSLQHIYVDTFYLQSYLLAKTDEEIYAKEQFNSAWSKAIRHDEIFLVIPFIVIGEAINNLKRRNLYSRDEVNINHSFANIMTNKHIDLKPAEFEVVDLVKRIRDNDDRLDSTDLMIVAQALCDPKSFLLLTNDPKLIDSSGINEVNRECSEEGWRNKLKIKDRYS